MKDFFIKAFRSCFDFKMYEEIPSQPMRKSFLYFIFIILISAVLIYPRYFKRQTDIIYPYLDKMSKTFPKVYFKNNKIIDPGEEYFVIDDPLMSIVIDPSGKYNKNNFMHTWMLFEKSSLKINYKDEVGQDIPYNNSFIMMLFTKLATMEKGTGVLNGEFFSNLKILIQNGYRSSGIYFCLHYLLMGFISTFLISVLAYFYSRMLKTSLSWKQIRSLSYYAITPVLFYMIICYYFNIFIAESYSMYMLIYFLFLGGALYRFRIPQEENWDL